jgi:hypothetical protein
MQINLDPLSESGMIPSSEATPFMLTVATSSTPPAFPQRPPLPADRPGRGVREKVKQPTQFRVGVVSIKECQDPKTGEPFYRLRWLDRETRK